MPDIAVIIPTYNRADLLPAALDSIYAQTAGATIEVAVVDDGSSDNTAAVVGEYHKRNGGAGSRVVVNYLPLSKAGVCVARNTGIAGAAPLVAFLDSDDFWGPAKLEKQLAATSAEGEVGVVHTSFRYVNGRGKPCDEFPRGQRLDNPCRGWRLQELHREDRVIFSSVLMKRSVIEEAARSEQHGQPLNPEYINGEDYDLLLRAARLAKFAYVAEPVTFYRVHEATGGTPGGPQAMANPRKVFGYHCRVQLDFAQRWGATTGIDEATARKRAADFLFARAETLFWQRRLGAARELCDLAAEMRLSDERFDALRRKASRPAWLYRVKDGVDRALRSIMKRDWPRMKADERG